MLTYTSDIPVGFCSAASLANHTLRYDTKVPQTFSNGSQTFQAAPKRNQTFPNYLYVYAFFFSNQRVREAYDASYK